VRPDRPRRRRVPLQGWPFDDHRAATDDPTVADRPLGGTDGDLVHPTDDDRFANDGADILEIRARPTTDGVAYRVALSTMVDPDAAVVAVSVDTGDATATDRGRGLVDATALAEGDAKPAAESFQDASTSPALNSREGTR